MKNRAISILVLVFGGLMGCSQWVRPPALPEEPLVKVGLISGSSEVVLSSNKSFTVRFSDKMARSNPGSKWRVRLTNDTLAVLIDDSLQVLEPSLPLVVHPEQSGSILINGKPYRGEAEVGRNPDGSLLVINNLSLEYYLMGVVPCEIGRMPPQFYEALKAQAVAARSYALSRKGKLKGQGFELYASTADQVYGGQDKESEITNRAVFETRGIVGIYDGKVIQANYSSTCGGVTANVGDVWKGSDIPYLHGIYDRPAYQGCCLLGVPPLSWLFPPPPFCANSPHFSWQKTMTKNEFYSTIGQITGGGGSVLVVQGLSFHKKNARLGNLEVRTNLGKVEFSSVRLRSIFDLPSDFFSMKIGNKTVEIEGHGWGHGVGMCQYGALGMAKQGYSYEKILKHYYRGIKLTRLY
jgi:stage II sporulation protein D